MRISAIRPLTALLAVLLAPACGSDPTGPSLADADTRILFIGNSLTYSNNLPGLVETVAEVAGHSVETAMLASPDFGLSDHWFSGAPELIRELRPDIVVLQQGPSTLPSSQAYLREWTDSLARVIRDVGAEPALMMVWPPEDPQYTFASVYASYRAAAEDVDGIFIPAGVAWLEAWKADDRFVLYAADRFHPAPLGSVVAAMTVVRTLFDQSLVGLPARMISEQPDRPEILLTVGAVELLFPAVDRAVEDHAIR
jgi:hypothetical protein